MQSRREATASPSSGKTADAPFEGKGLEWTGEDRRDLDRRHRPTRPWMSLRGPLRRVHGRRTTDRASYVDRYTRFDVALILAVFLMNVCDAFFTMLWLDRGGREANPVMDFFLDIGPGAFLVQKCLVVGVWLVVLLVHKNFRFARIGIYASLVVYALLTIVHFGIIAFDISPNDPQDAGRVKRVLESDLQRAGEGPGLVRTAATNPARRDISRRGDRPEAE